MLCLIKDRSWDIGNGNMKEDERGSFTYTGKKEESVIDYTYRHSIPRPSIKEWRLSNIRQK